MNKIKFFLKNPLLLIRDIKQVSIFFLFALFLMACTRGEHFEKPPIHPNPDMDYQPKYEAQESSGFFIDGASGRNPVEGTVARGRLRSDDAYYKGMKQGTEEYIDRIPIEMTENDLKRGRERYEIFCSMCHGAEGRGDGIVIEKGMIEPPDYHEEKVRNFPDGQIYWTITEGVRNMKSYKQQIPVDDRWRIVYYVRHLQKTVEPTDGESR